MKNNYTLKYNLKENEKKIYKVNAKTFFENLLIKSENEYEYKIDFMYLKRGIFDSYIIRNTRFDLINLSKKESKMEKIMTEINNFFPEVDYRISKKGEILYIENLDKLKSIWYEKRNEIRKKYAEEYKEIEFFINGLNQTINSLDVIKYFKNYSLNSIFFSELYGEIYIEENEKNKKISIPNFITFFSLPLNLNILTKEIDISKDELNLFITGKLNNLRLENLDIEEMLKENLPKENIVGLKYEVIYEQDISFYLSSGLVKKCSQIIEVKIFNKLDNKELFKNRIEIILEDFKEE